MTIYKKSTGLYGAWAKMSDLINVRRAKIVSETEPIEGKFGVQDVCKVQFEGIMEPLNVRLNRTTIDGLVDAFGEDSSKWQGHVLSVETETTRIGGKRVTILYLLPEGYNRIDDENGYTHIAKEFGNKKKTKELPPLENLNKEEEIKPEDIPF